MLPKDKDSFAPYSTLPARLTIKSNIMPIAAKTYIKLSILLIWRSIIITIIDIINETIANTNCLIALPWLNLSRKAKLSVRKNSILLIKALDIGYVSLLSEIPISANNKSCPASKNKYILSSLTKYRIMEVLHKNKTTITD